VIMTAPTWGIIY